MTLMVTPVQSMIGAEVTGLSGPAFVDPAVAAEVQCLLDAHGVVVCKGAAIGDADLVAFSHLLGPPCTCSRAVRGPSTPSSRSSAGTRR
jgi:alpha-ketoglutarate-dependent taurine dioxygenase